MLMISKPFRTRTFDSLLKCCILLTRVNAVCILHLAFLFVLFRAQRESWM